MLMVYVYNKRGKYIGIKLNFELLLVWHIPVEATI